MNIKFKKYGENWNCKVTFEKYQENGNTAICLIDNQDGSMFSVVTVNLNGLKENEVAIKNYSEGEGNLELLVENKIVSEPHRLIQSGYVSIPVCYLL